jgi:hypothetical protein
VAKKKKKLKADIKADFEGKTPFSLIPAKQQVDKSTGQYVHKSTRGRIYARTLEKSVKVTFYIQPMYLKGIREMEFKQGINRIEVMDKILSAYFNK